MLSIVVCQSIAWVQRSPTTYLHPSCHGARPCKDRPGLFAIPEDVVDVDFEPVEKKQKQVVTAPQDSEPASKSLIDISLESDPQFKDVRIPFCQGDEFIDVKLAFTVELEGSVYGIGVPFDDAVAILITEKDGDEDDAPTTTTYVNPDEYETKEDNQELMEIMAVQVQEQLGEELILRKTPRVLTISGGLGELTDRWQEEVVPPPASLDDLLQSAASSGDQTLDEEISDFYEFMKKELGEEEVKKTMLEDPSEEDRELMKLFDVPGMSGTDGLEDLIGSMVQDLEGDSDSVVAEAEALKPNQEGVSLKLIGFDFSDKSKSFTLVKLLQPYVLVGRISGEKTIQGSKNDDDDEEGTSDIRFDLLSREEEQMVIPKLEELCQSDLEASGLTLGGESFVESEAN